MLRKVLYLVIILFFAAGGFVLYTIGSGLRSTQSAVVEPIGNLVRQLAIQATPVILPDPATIVLEVNKLARLETASISLNKVLTAERNTELLWGAFGESLLFVAYGEVVAGVDLGAMTAADLQVVDPDTVMIHLPPAEVFNEGSALNTEQSYIAHRDEGILADADPQLETAVRRRAEQELLAAALEQGVVELADENARAYLTDFLRGLGFEEVIFTEGPPPPAPPFVQEVPKGFVVTPAP